MKFLIITNHSYMLWQFRRELISKLSDFGDVVISTPFTGHEDDFIKMGCKCIDTALDRRGINPITDLKLYKFYVDLLKKEQPDLVITYSIKPNIYAGMACSKLKIPYCVNVQGLGTAFQKEPIASIVTLMYRASVKKAKTVFFENRANANEFLKRKILPREKITVLRGAGVNLETYKLCEYPDEADGIHFLYLGRIMKEKGVDEFFEAAQKMKAKYKEKVSFDVVGFFEDEYKGKIDELVQNKIISFHGFQTNPIPYYEKAHCVVLPSYHEGMSNVLLESAAIGRPLISTDIPGCREAITDEVTGYLCRKADTKSLEDCMEKFISLNWLARKNMGLDGHKKMESEFDKNLVVKETISAMGIEEIKHILQGASL